MKLKNLKYAIIALFALVPTYVLSQECSPTQVIHQVLEEMNLQVAVRLASTSGNGDIITEIWVRPDTKAWVMFTTVDDVSCYVVEGDFYMMYMKPNL